MNAIQIGKQAKEASRFISTLSVNNKNQILKNIALALENNKELIQQENKKDLTAAKAANLSPSMIDRLTISDSTLKGMINGVKQIKQLDDPVGEITTPVKMKTGITVCKMRIPLGVITMIFESRPNVIVDAFALCFKAGNSVILKGGSEASNSNRVLGKIIRDVLKEENFNRDIIQVIDTKDREFIKELLKQEEYIDVVIPRGGESLIRFVTEHSKIPVLKHYKGVCHAYVDKSANLEMAKNIIINGKTSRPGVCNALEAVLIHKDIAIQMLPLLEKSLIKKGVTIIGCSETKQIIPSVKFANDEDYGKEFLDLTILLKVVEDFTAATDYIAKYGSNHTETIIADHQDTQELFIRLVDASAVMINSSTRFNDGGEFGLGAEIGISTSKLHAYGPMGLKELTTEKFIVYSDGAIRN